MHLQLAKNDKRKLTLPRNTNVFTTQRNGYLDLLMAEKKCILELLFIVRAVNNHLAKDRRTLTHKNVFATL